MSYRTREADEIGKTTQRKNDIVYHFSSVSSRSVVDVAELQKQNKNEAELALRRDLQSLDMYLYPIDN